MTVLQDTCPGLVGQIETGEISSPETRQILEQALHPMLAAGIDTVVLGCTHYPFVIPLIQEITGDSVRVIDPAPAVARQVERVLRAHNLVYQSDTQGSVRYLTTGDATRLGSMLSALVGSDGTAEHIDWDTIRKES